MLVLQNERGNTRLESHRGPARQRRRGKEERRGAHRRSKQHRAGSRQQCRPRSGPDGGTRGHIPRWLCLRNAVGAPLRRLPPSFFINRSHLPVLAKRNPLITVRTRWNNVTRVHAEFNLQADAEGRCRGESHRRERAGRREIEASHVQSGAWSSCQYAADDAHARGCY